MFNIRQRGAVIFRRQNGVIARKLELQTRSVGGKKKEGRRQVRCSSFVTSSSASSSTSASSSSSSSSSSSAGTSSNIFARMGAWYSKRLDSHPLLVKSLTGGAIAASGDALTQFGVYNPSEHENEDGSEVSFWRDVYDRTRTFHFCLLGALYAAPTGHFWYNYLAKYHAGKSLTWRVFVDQYLYTPVWTVVWLTGLWTMEGTKPKDLPQGMMQHLPDVMVANWILWTPAQFINFYAVPVKYQVLFTNFVELLWNAYLSFAAAGKNDHHSHHHHSVTSDTTSASGSGSTKEHKATPTEEEETFDKEKEDSENDYIAANVARRRSHL